MGDRRPKDSGGMNHHYKRCMEIMSKETSKKNLPLFNIEMTTKRKWDNNQFTSWRELHIYSL
jgi:hypothetical protein